MINYKTSTRWKNWKANIDIKTCLQCKSLHGKIYEIDEVIEPEPPLHPNCRCVIETLKAIVAGTATTNNQNGADWYLKHYGKLPDYYISYSDALAKGWKPKIGNLADITPGKMIYGGNFLNKEQKLPIAAGRTWYETDINYTRGFRNDERILFSSDGLIFATYDHYITFSEII
jgi:hypothetical protein